MSLQSDEWLVGRVASSLSPLERRVLQLSAADGLGVDAIAALIGTGRRRARRILVRALRKFDREMEREEQQRAAH